MASNTPNLNLRKPSGTDLVNQQSDIGDNMDKLDATHNAWTAFVPVWESTGVDPVLGNGSIAGRYRKVGKSLDITIVLTMGTTTTYGAIVWYFLLPAGLTSGPLNQFIPAQFRQAAIRHGHVYIDPGQTGLILLVDNGQAGGTLTYPTATVPSAWASGHKIIVSGRIEVA